VRGEDAVLLGCGQPRVQRHDLDPTPVELVGDAAQRLGGVTDLALARQEDQDVAESLAAQLLAGVEDRLGLIADDRLALLVLLGQLDERAVADLDRVRAARDLDDRCWVAAPIGEVLREPLRIDGRRGDDQLEVGAPRQQALEVAEQEVDVEASLVGLVDDDRVVAAQVAVALQLGEQDAVGHQLDPAGATRLVGEADLVPHGLAELGAQLAGDALGDRTRGDPARLGVADDAVPATLAPAELETDLGQLGGLAGSGLARDDDDLVVADGGGDVVTALRDRQLRREGDVHGGVHRASPGAEDRTGITATRTRRVRRRGTGRGRTGRAPCRTRARR
jgi:hypothetical protein